MTRLPVCRASKLSAPSASSAPFLIEQLWSDRAVGILGGEPKCGKSLLALEIAVAVAAGTACLRRFAVHHPGRVLLYAAEDALCTVRQRLEGIARAAQTSLGSLNLYVITAPVLRLDLQRDRQRLEQTVAAARPRLLVLDPFVRLHRIDENASAEVSPILAYLRSLERSYQTAVLLVHHLRKGAATLRPGQALRGSSELHAWGDSNLYLRRRSNQLRLNVEHRAAPSPNDIFLQLPGSSSPLALEIVQPPHDNNTDHCTTTPAAPERVCAALAGAATPLSLIQLRAACRMRTATLCETLADLVAEGTIRKHDGAYSLVR